MDNFVIPDIQPVDNNELFGFPDASGGHLQRIGNGMFKVELPDGSTQIVNGVGEIISSN